MRFPHTGRRANGLALRAILQLLRPLKSRSVMTSRTPGPQRPGGSGAITDLGHIFLAPIPAPREIIPHRHAREQSGLGATHDRTLRPPTASRVTRQLRHACLLRHILHTSPKPGDESHPVRSPRTARGLRNLGGDIPGFYGRQASPSPSIPSDGPRPLTQPSGQVINPRLVSGSEPPAHPCRLEVERQGP